MHIKRIKSETYHPASVLPDPNGATPQRIQQSKIKDVSAQARPTSQSLAEMKESQVVGEHMRGVEEQTKGHEDFYHYEYRPLLINEQIRNVWPRI